MPKRRLLPQLDDPRSWYQLERWRRIRRLQLNKEPLCRICAQHGIATAASVVDHIQPHDGDWNQFLTAELQSLCEHCHNSEKRFIDLHGHAMPRFGVDGWPIESKGEG